MKYPDPISPWNHFRPLNFHDLQGRLITFVVGRIRNGEFTERRLARILGVSQSQLHNVLKGARPLKPDFADLLLGQFEIGVLDLMDQAELATHLRSHVDAPGEDWPTPVRSSEARKPLGRVGAADRRARVAS